MTNIYQVARHILENINVKQGKNIPIIVIQNLCYLAQGTYMNKHKDILFEEEFDAYPCCPICRSLERVLYSEDGSAHIEKLTENKELKLQPIENIKSKFLDEFLLQIDKYIEPVTITKLTRDSSWKNARKDCKGVEYLGVGVIIPKNHIKESVNKQLKIINPLNS